MYQTPRTLHIPRIALSLPFRTVHLRPFCEGGGRAGAGTRGRAGGVAQGQRSRLAPVAHRLGGKEQERRSAAAAAAANTTAGEDEKHERERPCARHRLCCKRRNGIRAPAASSSLPPPSSSLSLHPLTLQLSTALLVKTASSRLVSASTALTLTLSPRDYLARMRHPRRVSPSISLCALRPGLPGDYWSETGGFLASALSK